MPYERIDTHGWSPDADPEMADWSKRTWDLPTTADEFLSSLTHSDHRDFLAEFMKLPAARAMPDSLRRELSDRGLLPTE